MENLEEDKRKQIVSLITVVGAGVGAALLISLFFLLSYGPTGRYLVETVLLSPSLLHELNYNDANPKTGGVDRFVFSKVVFSYLSPVDKLWHNEAVSDSEYANFYRTIQSEKSLVNPQEEMISSFMREPVSKLSLIVSTESSAAWQAVEKTFQEVQFSKNDNYFRIQLHEQNAGEHWAYFYRLGIGKEANVLFTK
ncbi:hypothetical protein PHSC3_000637 [Chlamydiales bacterium STE3]|nr:hypothetical protein PHSC3_000637 [Chlamydiales bacterium STE3]